MAGEGDETDLALVARVNRGEWEAFDVLYFRYRDRVYRLAWRVCGDAEEAQDVVQEVFVYLAGKFREGLELRAGMMTLLYPAVKHVAIGLRKKRRRMGELAGEDRETRAQGDKGTGVTGGDLQREELRGVMAGLSAEHREVLLMRFVDDMSLEEIAGALGIPLGTAKSRLHHAVKGMREDPRCRKYWEV